ncbi:hypothetical protein [Primorskyibacter marinus]|uniref:hypothetical protein n=1 Tax=Primorskyibacter marinus TaxID=1977320 RepID=UPI000E308AE0|nr:hypothetical protein [Primorskyibacter marinus]
MKHDHQHDLYLARPTKVFKVAGRGRDILAGNRSITAILAFSIAHEIDAGALRTYLIVMLVHADHFRFLLLNRPFPRAV